jgi:multiple sugar transport system substrate-binding protein
MRNFHTLAAAVLLASGACGDGESGDGEKKISIRVLAQDEYFLQPFDFDRIVKDFEVLNPKIDVTMEYSKTVHDTIVAGLATNPPKFDAAMIDVIWPDEFVEAGYLLDVTSRVTPDMKAGIFPAAFNGVTRNGKIWGMPWLMDVKYFMYNKDILQRAGFNTPPRTWEELATQATAIKQNTGLGIEFPIVWSWNKEEAVICDYAVLLFGNGGRFLDDAGKPAFNDDRGVAALAWMKATLDSGLSNPRSKTANENHVEEIFLAGKAAFAVNWLFQYAESSDPTKSQVNGQVAFAPMPIFADSGVTGNPSVDGSSSYAVMAKSPHPDEAWKFLTYLTSNEVQMKYSAKMLPIWKDDFQGATLKELEAAAPTNPVTIPAFLAQFPHAIERPTVSYYVEASAALQVAIADTLSGAKSPRAALDEAAAKWVALNSK